MYVVSTPKGLRGAAKWSKCPTHLKKGHFVWKELKLSQAHIRKRSAKAGTSVWLKLHAIKERLKITWKLVEGNKNPEKEIGEKWKSKTEKCQRSFDAMTATI